MNHKKRMEFICEKCGQPFTIPAAKAKRMIKVTGHAQKLCHRWCNGTPRVVRRV